jgi:hypothetical protein
MDKVQELSNSEYYILSFEYESQQKYILWTKNED